MKPNIAFRKHILIPLSVTLVILLAASIVNTYRLQRSSIIKDAQTNFEKAQQTIFSGLSENSRLLSNIIDLVKRDKMVQNAWLTRNRAQILRYMKPIIEDYPINKNITHLYFIDLNSICFLRVHKPESLGDVLNHFILNQAIRSVASASGIELGAFGTLTFRVVRPWWINGELTGYIEAGVEIEHIITHLEHHLGSDLMFTIEKSYLDRSKWEEGSRMLGRKGDWNQFPKFVIVDKTLDKISSKLESYIRLHVGRDEKQVFNFSTENRNYRVGFIPLIDAGGRRLGDIIVLKDITKEELDLHSQVLFLIISSAVIGVLMLGFFYLYIGRIELRLNRSHDALKDEIVERKQAEKALKKSQDKLEWRVQERTNDLKRANEQLQLQLVEGKKAEAQIRRLSQGLFNSIEEERSNIARDLHDEFGQALTTLRFGIETLANSLSNEFKEQKTKCDTLVHIIEQQRNNISHIVSELRPDMLDHIGLVSTMKWYIQNFVEQIDGLHIDFQAIGIKTRPDAGIEIIVYRILQESLTNIARHAKAKNVNITLTHSYPSLIFVIKDDGVGFEPVEFVSMKHKNNPGIGLIGMRERITAAKGIIDIRSTKGKGTAIRVELPINLRKTDGKNENIDSRRP